MRRLRQNEAKGGGVNNKTGRWGGYGGAACQVGRSHKQNGSEVFYGFLFGKVKKMTKNKGFTLIELMVVILIVAILAAVLAPMLSGRINESKWTEGKTGAGTVATALRAWAAEQKGLLSAGVALPAAPDVVADLGLSEGDLQGKYFSYTSYKITGVSMATTTEVLSYTIAIAPDINKAGYPKGFYKLDGTGLFTYGATAF